MFPFYGKNKAEQAVDEQSVSNFCDRQLEKFPQDSYNDAMSSLFSVPMPPKKNIFRLLLFRLLLAAVVLPMGSVFLFVFGRLFSVLGDSVSSAILDGAALVAALCWILVLISLLFCTVVVLLNEEKEDVEEE